ncbi:MAG: cbb3-type cytochrome c oxidase subunit 3 [Gammaproteobacteria bacterium]|nr:cbb3-type cytochrome c oxidase subunit 3 [Gammaproteobacteria bacterium]MBV8404695.1 cbb3-type cytochrome c oxidase subunit 3 [Gammaproteobacteria bacterium]
MDFEFLSGLVTLLWFLAFVGLWLWAWSGRRERDYAAAARLPLDETADAGSAGHEGSA